MQVRIVKEHVLMHQLIAAQLLAVQFLFFSVIKVIM